MIHALPLHVFAFILQDIYILDFLVHCIMTIFPRDLEVKHSTDIVLQL